MAEYDQAIIRLGLEKAKLNAELDTLRSEANEIGARKATLLDDIVNTEKKLSVIRQEIKGFIDAGEKKIVELSRSRQKTGQKTEEKKKILAELEGYLISFNNKLNTQQSTLFSIKDELSKKRKLLSEANNEFNTILIEKRSVEADIISLQELKKELKEAIESNEKKLEYLADKEQFLNRKEADLIKYEKRVEKMREDAGNKNKMSFK